MREISFLPKKHISLELSLIGFGATLIELLENGMTSEDLWSAYMKKNNNIVRSYDEFILALDFLYMVGAISLRDNIICLN